MNINTKSIKRKLMCLFGILAPAPILSIFSVTFYTIFILFFGVWFSGCLLAKQMKIKKGDMIYFLFVIWVLISYFICASRMPDLWTNGLIKSFIQFVCLVVLYYSTQSKRYDYLKIAFVKGVYYSSIIQVIWCFIQFVIFKGFSVDINIIIFKDILKMYAGNTSTIYSGGYVSGLCWHYGNLAALFIFGFIYSRNLYLKILFVLASFLAGRTVMVGMIILLLMIVVNQLKKKHIKSRTIVLALATLLGGVAFFVTSKDFVYSIVERLSNITNIKTYYLIDPSANAHVNYLIKIPEITKNNDIITNLFGFGPECSGFAFSKYYGQFPDMKWVLECDYSNVLWNYGYIGFILYYIWYVINIIRSTKIDKNYLFLFVTFLMMGFMYNTILNWVQLLILFIFSLARNGVCIWVDKSVSDKGFKSIIVR